MSLKTTKSNIPANDAGSVVVIERNDWNATPPKNVEQWKADKVENIVMTTSATETCNTQDECIIRVKEIQERDMREGHPDIKYNFLVGQDGNVYEGRGWRVSTRVSKVDGDKFSYLDGNCLYIAFIGPKDMTPSSNMFTAMSGLSSVGVENDMIGREVKIIRIEGNHHQVYDLNLDEAMDDDKEFQAKEQKQIM